MLADAEEQVDLTSDTAKLIYLAKAVVEFSDYIEDRDGLSNRAEIAVDVATRILDTHGL